jgi:hypothetical protein
MPLSATRLSASMRVRLLARADSTGAVDGPALTAMCDELAAAVVDEIKLATVLPVLLVAPPGGGPVTGVGTIT